MVGELDSKLNAVPDPKPRKERKPRQGHKSGPRTKREEAIVLAQIRAAEAEGKTDLEIAQLLGITLRNYYKTWVPKLYKQDKVYIETLSKPFIHHQLIVLRDRLLGVLARASARANNSALTGGVRNEADRLVMEVSINLFKLVKDGPSVLGIKVQDLEAEDGKQSTKAQSPSGQVSAQDMQIIRANPTLAGKLPGYGGLEKVIIDDHNGDRHEEGVANTTETSSSSDEMPEES